MANKDEDKKNHTTDQQPGGELGRTHNSQDPAVEEAGTEHDISAMDQQEGTMQNGETGGSGLVSQPNA